jgi:methyl-accepting chemotaxis protein
MAALKYRIQASDAAANEVESNIDEIVSQNAKMADFFAADADAQEQLRELGADTDAYRVAFEEMQALQARREEIYRVLVESGAEALPRLTKIMETAYRDGDADAAYHGGITQEQLLLGRLYVMKFLLENDHPSAETALSHIEEADSGMAELLTMLENTERRRLAGEVRELLATYRTAFVEMIAVISDRNTIQKDQLDALGPQMQDQYENMTEAVVDQQNTLGPKATATIASTKVIIAIVGVLAILGGAVIAWFVGRSIARAVTRMAETMERMAGGDLDMEVAGDEHKHELGSMAGALKVFQANGRAKIAADAEAQKARQAAEAARAQQAEKDAAVAARQAAVVEALKRSLSTLAEGDLTVRIGSELDGEFAAIRDSFNATVDKLRTTCEQIMSATRDMRKATGEISEGAADLSSRAENQAASLEEVAATMEEMSATVKKNAENAVSASSLSADARNRADKGGQIVEQAVTAMSEIEAGSAKIADIVSVIDGFAFQTNLLALNAAVEAARAGEAGKGFAVVASEVRTLAQRSAEAARDIKELIDQSSGQVKDGVRLVKETGESLASIMDAIRQVSDTITEISEASREQSSGVDEITSALTSMDEITQQNSALAEESASAARGLGERANGLDRVVSFFRMTGEGGAAAFDADARADSAAAARAGASAA